MEIINKIISVVLIMAVLLCMASLGACAASDATVAVGSVSEYVTEPGITELCYGDTDISGAVNIKDATHLQKHLAGLLTIDEDYLVFCDVNEDGRADIKDATAIQKYLVGLEEGTGVTGQRYRQETIEKCRVLVAYFSCTGNTERIAEYIAELTSADVYRIVPKVPYTDSDLDYNNNSSRANREQNDADARPEISGGLKNTDAYDTIFVGYPIWWGKLPKIMYTFFESCDLAGKRIIPFCTSGSTGIKASVNEIKALEPDADVHEGRRFSAYANKEEVKELTDTVISAETDAATDNNKKDIGEVKISCNDRELTMKLSDNPSAKEFSEKLKEGDLTIKMNDFGGFEKTGRLGFDIVRSDEDIHTSAGDVILYLGNTVAIYYGENSWDFTLLGRIEGMTTESMLEFFGGMGEVEVTFSVDQKL